MLSATDGPFYSSPQKLVLPTLATALGPRAQQQGYGLPTTAGEQLPAKFPLLATVATLIQMDHRRIFGDSSAVPARDFEARGRGGVTLGSNLMRFRVGKDEEGTGFSALASA